MSLEIFPFQARTEDDERVLEVAQPADQTDYCADGPQQSIGQTVQRHDAIAKVTGQARYTADQQLPGMLYAGVVRCQAARAVVRNIRLDKAWSIPGVMAILSSDASADDSTDIGWYDEEVPLFGRHLRYQGDEIAAVAAQSREALADALAAIEVDLETSPAVFESTRALDSQAPKVHDDGNLNGECRVSQRGDVDAALAQAEIVIEREFRTQAAVHHALESHGTVAAWEGDQLTLHESTQGIYAVRDKVASALGLTGGQVRVICDYMGGGFGAKQVPWKHTIIAALLARRTGRPVQLLMNRSEEALANGHRNETVQRVRLAARADGQLTAIDLEAWINGGAYTVGGESSDVGGIFKHLYECENVRTREQRVYTHTGPAVAFRAPGYAEGCFALESAMDELATRLAMDPMDLRLRNYARADQSNGKPWSSPDALERCYARADETFGWRNRQPPSTEPDVRHGFGLAAHEWLAGSAHPPAYAWLKMGSDASVEVIVGAQDIGTGTRTILAQTAAEILQVPVGKVSVRLGDTGSGPPGPTSSGSATTPTMVPAVSAAAANAVDQITAAAAQYLDCPQGTLRLKDGRLENRDGTGESIALPDLLARLSPHTIQGHGSVHAKDDSTSIRPFGVQCAQVKVNTRTGEVTVVRVVCAPDCGRVLNPRLAESQVIGGVTQGLGYALFEQRIIDERIGRVLNANLEDYLIPTIADVPAITHAVVDIPDTNANALGVKGLGELPLIPTAPAIANAIFDAVGVRIERFPVTREAILEGLANIKEGHHEAH